jgi:hypothetical protein
MGVDRSMRIAGQYTARQRWRLSARLEPAGRLNGGALDDDWQEAIDVVRIRFETRFVRPVDVLRRLPYAGFLMVAIDSLLAEAIERARRGWHFEHGKSCELVVEFCRRGKGWKS